MSATSLTTCLAEALNTELVNATELASVQMDGAGITAPVAQTSESVKIP